MANQAFALSPISARANLPSEEDYEAIREAFMETARGRWFLDEYARRNRNADTHMVLDAVSRIEETLVAQRQPPPPPPDDKRAEMLSAIESAVGAAEQTASAALDGPGIEENLAPIRKGARIIREISWRWREIGADARICDLLDSQVGAIEAGCSKIAEVDPRIALREAFDIIKASISAFSDIAGAAPAPALDNVAIEPSAPAAVHREAAAETAAAFDEPLAEPDRQPEPGEEEDYDEAMLERVAMEMAAPDLEDADAEFALTEPPQAEVVEAPQVRVTEPPRVEPVHAPETGVVQEPALSSPPVAPDGKPSLGATVLATGLVTRPKAPANDPLAPIRRMSQAEKIAFFS